MRIDLRKRLFLSFAGVIVALSLVGSVVGAFIINRAVVDEAQNRIRLDLRAAWAAYNGELHGMKDVVRMMAKIERIRRWIATDDHAALEALLEQLRLEYGWDFLSVTDATGRVVARGRYPYNRGDDRRRAPFIRRALAGEEIAATQILPPGVLELEGEGLTRTAFMAFAPTPKAKPRPETEERSGMALEAAIPVYGTDGKPVGVVYGGVLLNRRYTLVDQVKDTVFKGERYDGKDLGTVTIFQWDLRIATNVMMADGNRAIGTRVSAEVYDQVLENGRSWVDRAFVVNDWYITAYDPIRDVDDRVVGILYVGVLEEKYRDLRNQIVFAFLGVTLLGAVLVLGTSYLIARHLAGPIQSLVEGSRALSDGDLDHRVDIRRNDEIGDLTKAFNGMAASLEARQEELRRSNEELTTLNRNYMEMLGFVSHELKNAVGSCITNAYSLKDGILGPLSTVQKRAVEGIAANLDYFEEMIENYLDLSRIEKGELQADKRPVRLYSEIVAPALQAYEGPIRQMEMTVDCDFSADQVSLSGDASLLRIAYNNLVENAAKYGRRGGTITMRAIDEGDHYLLNVRNDGAGIPRDQADRLFRKFSRIEGTEGSRKKGTGLGLFVTREIIEKHGGRIWVESAEGEWADFRFTLPKNGVADAAVAAETDKQI